MRGGRPPCGGAGCAEKLLREGADCTALSALLRCLALQRSVRFTVREWEHRPGALPLREVGGVEFSPFNPSSEP